MYRSVYRVTFVRNLREGVNHVKYDRRDLVPSVAGQVLRTCVAQKIWIAWEMGSVASLSIVDWAIEFKVKKDTTDR